MAERIDVFISSTARDLTAYRDAVTNVVLRLGLHPLIMEAFNPTDRNALQLCYDQVQSAEIFVGIYAHRYGYAPGTNVTYKTTDGEQLTGDGETSITHLEYLWAMKRGLPMLLFIVSDLDAAGNPLAWPVAYIEDEPGKTRLKNFKNLIMSQHVLGFFHSPDHLAAQLATGLNEIAIKLNQARLNEEIQTERNQLLALAEKRQREPKRKVVGERLGNVFQFLDRTEEQQRLCQLLLDSKTRLVSVVSRGGMGKTSLAAKVLSYFEEKRIPFGDVPVHIDGIIYLSTRSSTSVSLERVFLSFGQLLNREAELGSLWNSPSLTLREKVERLLDLVHEGTYILLLDNLEDLLDARGALTDPEIQTLLAVAAVSNHTVRILITSRIALTTPPDAVRINHEIPLLEGLTETAGVQLLRALDVNGEFGLREAAETQLAQAVTLVKGVPRALEVICSILANDPVLTLDELLLREEIFHHPNFVERLVEENYGAMEVAARQVLEALAVYGRPVPEVAVDHLLQTLVPGLATREILTRLVKTHVISADRATRTYYLHPIDADYLYNQLPLQGAYSRPVLNQLAAEYYAKLCLPPDKWHSLEDLQPHFRQYEHALRAENYNLAAAAINPISEQLNIWGYMQRNSQMLLALDGKITDPILTARFQNNLAYIYTGQNNAIEAIKHFNQAIAAATNQTEQAWLQIHYEALVGIGTAYRKTGRYKDGADYLEQAINFKRNHSLLSDAVEPLSALGLCISDLGEQDRAIEYITKSLEEAIQRDDALVATGAKFYLSVVHSTCGYWEAALALHQEAISMADNINSARTRGFSRIEFAKTLLRTQQLDRAETVLQEAQVIAEEIQNAEHFQYVKYVFALYFLRLQRLDEALKCIQAAAQITTHWLDFEIALLQGILLARLSDTAAARQTFERAIAFIGQISPEYFYVDYAYSLAYSGLACISPMEPSALIQKARSALERAIHKCAPLGSVGDVAWLLSELMPLDHDGILVPLQQRLATVNPRDE